MKTRTLLSSTLCLNTGQENIFTTLIMSKKRIAVLTGAGVSAESGLKTYRDNNGLWDNYDPMEVASVEGWRRNPKLVLDFYNMQRAKLKDARPNEAHKDRKSTRLNSSHQIISYAVFCLKKK